MFRRFLGMCFLACAALTAQEPKYFVTYSHHIEEPGNLEVGIRNVWGSPKGGNAFLGSATEIEYGVKGWWTTEFYLDGQHTSNESTTFTGYRFENRFRPLAREHRINPVGYFEFENINSADKSLLEVVGHDGKEDFLERTSRAEKKREIETKLILSSNAKGWNISENFIAEKNLAGEPWEFGYAFGVARPLATQVRANECTFCRENFSAGLEAYGGLGDTQTFGFRDTSHYVAPLLTWRSPEAMTFTISPSFGLSDNSHRFLLRFGVSYEVTQIASKFRGDK